VNDALESGCKLGTVRGGIAPQGVKRQFVLDVTRRSKGPCSISGRAAGHLRPQRPAAQQDKTAGRAELPHQEAV
jgi:hypothetical protein